MIAAAIKDLFLLQIVVEYSLGVLPSPPYILCQRDLQSPTSMGTVYYFPLDAGHDLVVCFVQWY